MPTRRRLPAGFPVRIPTPANPPELRLSLLLRRNFYFIYEEARHNSLKHAVGTPQVAIRLALEAGCLQLEVSNEAAPAPAGNPTPVPAHQRRRGHGLRNIAQRAAALGGTASSGVLPGGRAPNTRGYRIFML